MDFLRIPANNDIISIVQYSKFVILKLLNLENMIIYLIVMFRREESIANKTKECSAEGRKGKYQAAKILKMADYEYCFSLTSLEQRLLGKRILD